MNITSDWPEDPVGVIAEKYGFDRATTLEKIRKTKKILGVNSYKDAVDFLLSTKVGNKEGLRLPNW